MFDHQELGVGSLLGRWRGDLPNKSLQRQHGNLCVWGRGEEGEGRRGDDTWTLMYDIK